MALAWKPENLALMDSLKSVEMKTKAKVGILHPIQQPMLYWDGPIELPLVGGAPTHRRQALFRWPTC